MKKSRKTLFIAVAILFAMCLTACGDPVKGLTNLAPTPTQNSGPISEPEPEPEQTPDITP